jgi:hypothetical protein
VALILIVLATKRMKLAAYALALLLPTAFLWWR